VTTSLLLCFGGGVLLATAMLHILPEVPVISLPLFLPGVSDSP
jgi:hypothetical protein